MSRYDSGINGASSPVFVGRVLSSLPAALLVISREGIVSYAGGNLDLVGGRTSEQLTGSRLVDYVDPAEHDLVAELLAAAFEVGGGVTVGPVRVTYVATDETRRVAEIWGVNCSDDPEIQGVVALLLPESAYDRLDQALMGIVNGVKIEHTLGALSQALRYPPASAESFFLMPRDDDRALIRSPELAEVPGPPSPGPWDMVWESAEPVVHDDLGALVPDVRQLATSSGFKSVGCFPVHIGTEGRTDACLVVWSRAEGPLPVNARLAIDRATAVATLAISHSAAESRLRDAAFRDALTGLGNRRSYFEALVEQVVAGEQPAVLYIDLDGFKAINDRLGHLAGDAVLRVVARRLASVMRPTDELARLGGDEFAVLCGNPVSTEQMVMIAKRVLDQLSGPLSVGSGESVETGASIGIALGLPVGTPADAIIAHADRALYIAKQGGRGRWAFSDPRVDASQAASPAASNGTAEHS
ncbi:MAG: diguanylate cyclase domain-containing protein [Acidimicrobiales bacterium]